MNNPNCYVDFDFFEDKYFNDLLEKPFCRSFFKIFKA
jgi:hypothetical protein